MNLNLRANPFFLSDADIAWVDATRARMTTEDKIRQLFCLILYDDDDALLLRMARDVRPCGVMYRPMSTEKCLHATSVLQRESAIPMLIAANLERGGSGLAVDGTTIGAQMQVAATADVKCATRLGEVCGREATAVGGNWAFAPVIDVDMNFRNPITNVRTYGADPVRVREMGRAYVEAVQREGVAASIKHFPGDGVDERDQHLVLSINALDCEEWDSTYGEAYRASIEAGALTVMAGHIAQPAWSRRLRPGIRDEDILPGSLAPELLQDLLRDRLGFNGLIVSDATVMSGFMTPLPRPEAVPRCIAAGCDVFLFSRDTEEDISFMRRGLETGILTEERLDEAVTRILALKAALKLHTRDLQPDETAARAIVGCEQHREWARDCADKAVTLVKNKGDLLPVSPETHRRITLIPLTGGTSHTMPGSDFDAAQKLAEALRARGFEVTLWQGSGGFEGKTPTWADTVGGCDLMLYVANLQTKSNQTTVRIEWAMPLGANCPNFVSAIPTALVSFANPYHLLDAPRVHACVNAYTATDEVVEAVAQKLTGESAFRGTSPVDAFAGRWDARL